MDSFIGQVVFVAGSTVSHLWLHSLHEHAMLVQLVGLYYDNNNIDGTIDVGVSMVGVSI